MNSITKEVSEIVQTEHAHIRSIDCDMRPLDHTKIAGILKANNENITLRFSLYYMINSFNWAINFVISGHSKNKKLVDDFNTIQNNLTNYAFALHPDKRYEESDYD